MSFLPAIANILWTQSNLPAYWEYHRALRNPRPKQETVLRQCLERNAETAFGRRFGFAEIRSYEEFAERVPIVEYDEMEGWIARIRKGEERVLTEDRVTHLIPTSGSSGGRKLIPFTTELQREFNAAIGAWVTDLFRQFPKAMRGPAYWSVTPVVQESKESKVPIGFDDDAAYVGGKRRALVEEVMAVPAAVGKVVEIKEFRYRTLLHLLRRRDLSLISVWHPSFLTLLLDELPNFWERLLNEIGGPRAAELNRLDLTDYCRLWPKLRVISCWGDGHAVTATEELHSKFPSVVVQPKGIIATEAFVSLPFRGRHPLAVTSHFFEFIDLNGNVSLVDALREGERYEVVVTTGGGLYRYRLGDVVTIDGLVGKTPSVRFVGRGNSCSDLCGEKLTEQFVARCLSKVVTNGRFSLLAPDRTAGMPHYTLFAEGELMMQCVDRLEMVLRENPHYPYARELGQLGDLKGFRISRNGYASYAARLMQNGQKLGNIKPAALSNLTGWREFFEGNYLECLPSLASSEGM
jgi:hypothetical protein